MNRNIYKVVGVIAVVVILCLLYFYHSQHHIIKFEVYENSSEYLVITYFKNNSISFTVETKSDENYRAISCGADFIDEGLAVFDGKKALPEMTNVYYEFLFRDDYVEWYNNGEYQSTYDLIVRKSIK